MQAQPGFSITLELRAKATGGPPLFSRSAMKDSDANIRRGMVPLKRHQMNAG